MATSGEFQWPPLGRNRWPLTVNRRLVGILPAMHVPAWRLPAAIVILSLASLVLLPGAPPAALFAGMLASWALAALLFVALRRRERRAAAAAALR